MPRDYDQIKIIHDLMKHIATLSSGSILLIATFSEKFPRDAPGRELLKWGVGCLIVSLVASLLVALTALPDRKGDMSNAQSNVFAGSFMAVLIGFVAGIICIGVFAYQNV